MTNPINPPSQNRLLRFLNGFWQSTRQNTVFIIAATIGGFASNLIGFSVDIAEFSGWFSDKDISEYKAGWILVKIQGWSDTSYNPADRADGIGSLFVSRLRGQSLGTSMIYTDKEIETSYLTDGTSPKYDFSVLTNEDYSGKVPGRANDIDKKNSQTLQAHLIQAHVSKKPVCLFVYGIRDNKKSQFLNILKIKNLQSNDIDKNNELVKGILQGVSELDQLTTRACGSRILPRIINQ